MRSRRILKFNASFINKIADEGGWIFLIHRGVCISGVRLTSNNPWLVDDLNFFANQKNFVNIRKKIEDEDKIKFHKILHYTPEYKEKIYERHIDHAMTLIRIPLMFQNIVRGVFVDRDGHKIEGLNLFMYLSQQEDGKRDLRVIHVESGKSGKLDCYHLEVGPPSK